MQEGKPLFLSNFSVLIVENLKTKIMRLIMSVFLKSNRIVLILKVAKSK